MERRYCCESQRTYQRIYQRIVWRMRESIGENNFDTLLSYIYYMFLFVSAEFDSIIDKHALPSDNKE